MEKLNDCLNKMFREVINTNDKGNQLHYLKKTYEWFVTRQAAVGLLGKEQLEKEHDFLYPGKLEAKQ